MSTIQEDFRAFADLDRRRTGEGLTPEEFRRWQLLHHRLEKTFSGGRPNGALENRQSLRLPTRLRVVYDVLTGSDGTVVNLSRGGCFIRADLPAAMGTRLTLLLHATNISCVLELDSEVVSTNTRSSLSGRGMGLRFLEMEAETQKKLNELYESILALFAWSPGR
jgi:uncharacterized protein (TIGR02266 family)